MKDPSIPIIVSDNSSDAPTDIQAESTQAQVADQGYTYNQPGFTYNQAGWMYGGIYNQNFDLSPEFVNNTASLLSPSISSIIDVGTHPAIPPGPNNQKIVGPGWFMYVSR